MTESTINAAESVIERLGRALELDKLIKEKHNMLTPPRSTDQEKALLSNLQTELDNQLSQFNEKLKEYGAAQIMKEVGGEFIILNNFYGLSISLSWHTNYYNSINKSPLTIKYYRSFLTAAKFRAGDARAVEEFPYVIGVNDNLEYTWSIGSNYFPNKLIVEHMFSWLIANFENSLKQ